MDVEEVQYRRIGSGVAGWLAVFCLALVYSAAASFYHIASVTIPQLIRAQTASLNLLLGAFCVLFLLTASLGFVAGAKLWLVQADAVSFAKRFLVINVVAHVTYFLLWLAVVHPDQLNSIFQIAWYHVVGPSVSGFMWYSYLNYSKRVRETYAPE